MMKALKKNNFYNILVGDSTKHTDIYIYDEIGEDCWSENNVTALNFIKEFGAIPQDHEITIRINSPGGSISDGLAIYNAIKGRKDNVTCQVDGLCASIASVIALAGGKVTMQKAGAIMIHKPWCSCGSGNADELRKTADMLDFWENQLLDIYNSRTGIDKAELKEMLSEETWLNAEQCLEKGFVDEIIDNENEEKLVACLNFENKGFKHGGWFFSNIKNKVKTIKEKEIEEMSEENNKASTQPVAEDKEVKELRAQLETMKKAEQQRKIANAKAVIAKAVEAGKIENVDSAKWESLLIADESNAELLDKLPGKQSNSKHVEANALTYEVEADPNNIVKEAKNMRGRERSMFMRSHRDKLLKYAQNAITVTPDLKQDVIMSSAIEEFGKITGDIPKMFSTMFKDVQLDGTDTIRLPYYPSYRNVANDYKNFDYNSGYLPSNQYAIQSKSITCDKRIYVGFEWTSYDLARTPFFVLDTFFRKMAIDLGWQLWNELLGQITVANYPLTGTAAPISLNSFDSDVLADVKLKCDTEQWGYGSRNMVLNSTAENRLLKDPGIKNYSASNTTSPLYNGGLPSIYGFNIRVNPNLPDNGEDLLGFVCMPEAFGIVNAPIRPDAHITAEYDQAVDPDSGITLEARWWGDNNYDKAKVTLECNIGYDVLQPTALIRLVQA